MAIKLSDLNNYNTSLNPSIFDKNASAKKALNDAVVQPDAQRPPNSKATALVAANRAFATSCQAVNPKQNLSSDKVSDAEEQSAQEIEERLEELEKSSDDASEIQKQIQALKDQIKQSLKDAGASDEEINDVMTQIDNLGSINSMQESDRIAAIADILHQVSQLTNKSEQTLASKIEDRLDFNISNNERNAANYADEGKAMLDEAKARNPLVKQSLEKLKNMDKLNRSIFLTKKDQENLGYTNPEDLKRNLFITPFGSTSPLGKGGMSPELKSGIMMAAADSGLLALNQQITNFLQDLNPLVSGISPQASQAFNELLKKFQAETTAQVPVAAQGVGNPQPQPTFDYTQTSTYRQFMLRLESSIVTDKATEADNAVTTQLAKDQKAADDENIQKQEDAMAAREAAKHMSWIQKLFHAVASLFVDLGNLVSGVVKTVKGFLTHNSALQASGVTQIASAATGLIRDIAEVVLDAINNNDPRVRSQLEDVLNKVANALQDFLTAVAGAVDVALGETVQGAAMIAAGVTSLAIDVTIDVLDSVNMDSDLRKKIEMGLNITKDMINIGATLLSLGGAVKGAKEIAQIIKGGAQKAEKAATKSKFETFADRFQKAKNISDSLVAMAGGGIDISTAVYKGKAATAQRDAELAKINLDFDTKILADSTKNLEQQFESLRSFLSAYFASLQTSFKISKNAVKWS